MEKLVDCKRCSGNACYEQVLTPDDINEIVTTWMCMGCGFTTSTLMKENGKLHTELLDTAPELYKDLLYVDDTKNVWAPSTITIPKKGMVFIDGTTKDNWNWTAVRAIKLTQEEIKSGQYPEGNEYKMDMTNKKVFSKSDFMDAMENIGFFNIEV
jgi:hypothetical protein